MANLIKKLISGWGILPRWTLLHYSWVLHWGKTFCRSYRNPNFRLKNDFGSEQCTAYERSHQLACLLDCLLLPAQPLRAPMTHHKSCINPASYCDCPPHNVGFVPLLRLFWLGWALNTHIIWRFVCIFWVSRKTLKLTYLIKSCVLHAFM